MRVVRREELVAAAAGLVALPSKTPAGHGIGVGVAMLVSRLQSIMPTVSTSPFTSIHLYQGTDSVS
jgi:hypothetical protein